MTKPKYLYHGSPKELRGLELLPNLAEDLEKNPHNMLKGVYASDLIDEAIAMGIITSKGVHGSSCSCKRNSSRVNAVIYEGWPEQEHIYLHTLPSRTFENRPIGGHQWVSLVPVRPIKTERLEISKYLYLIKKATPLETKKWNDKFLNNN